MIVTVAYYVVLVAVLAYLAIYGGRTGRWGGALQFLTSVASLAAAIAFYKQPVLTLIMPAIDFVSLAWKMTLAICSNRSWPIWVAAFQLNVVAAHISIWLIPSWEGHLYYAMGTVWAVPTLLAMLAGTALDRRHELRSR